MADTIAACATPLNPSGIGIIRISGDEAIKIGGRIFRPKKEGKDIRNEKSHTIHYGHIYDGDEKVDEVLVSLMRGPHSYTGEDIVEINCHGGVLAMQRVLETCIKEGCRLAEPGEFSKRAFLHGKMDLSRAEAVMDLIHSENEYARKNSLRQLSGILGQKIDKLRKEILYHIAFIESALDDPEHISVDGYGDQLLPLLAEQKTLLKSLLNTVQEGKLIKEGIRTVILGKPNAGKSSLLNLLLGEERAIVTDIAGTTRDTLEETIKLRDISLRIADTAGIRSTEDVVEKIGVERALEYAKDADLILYVVDGSVELDENDRQIMKLIGDEEKKTVVIMNKSDLPLTADRIEIERELSLPVTILSTKTGQGLEELEERIARLFFSGEIGLGEEIMITNIRHKKAIEKAYESLELVESSIKNGMPEDFLTIDLMDAYNALGLITGESAGEDLVNEIFAKFCTGK